MRRSVEELDDAVLWRFSAIADLTVEERRAILSMLGPVSHILPGQTLRSQEEEPRLHFLLDGWVLSGITTADGTRQLLKVHRPGDLLGSPSLPFARAAEGLTALTAAKVSPIALRDVGTLFERWPRVAAILYLAAQAERVALMDRLVAVGRFDAAHSFAALLVQMVRTRPPGSAETALHLPLTQPQLGDVLGLSTVHVNRVINRFEREGLIRREGYVYHLLDLSRLEAFAGLPRRDLARNATWLPAPAR